MKKQIYVSIQEASELSSISKSAFITAVDKKQINYSSSTDYETLKENKQYDKIFIPIDCLPPFAIENYIQKNIPKTFSLNLAGYQLQYGTTSLFNLLQNIHILNTIMFRHHIYYSDNSTKLLQDQLDNFSLPRGQYYEQRRIYMKTELKQLQELHDQPIHTSICPLAKNYIIERVTSKYSPAQDDIIDSLKDYAKLTKETACLTCPFNKDTEQHKQAIEKLETCSPGYQLEICTASKQGMIVSEDSDHSLVSRIKSELPQSFYYFCKNSIFEWDGKFGHKVQREYINLVNELWCADEHECDVYLYDKKTKEIFRPWISLIIDMASGIPVGSAISRKHNHKTTIEAFCKAAVPTLESDGIIYGLPTVFMMDNGSSYKNETLIGSKEIRKLLREDPTTTLFSHGLLHALSVKPWFCKPKSAWSKPIERVFRTIECRWFRRLYGYCGGRKKAKYKRNPKAELKRLRDSGKLWTIEQFADHWFHRVIPEYCNYSFRGKKTPMEKYKSLPRAKTITPTWETLSVLMHKKKKHRVEKQGILHNGHYYTSPELAEYIGEKVYVFSFDNAYPQSICAVYSNPSSHVEKLIGEIPIKEKIQFIEEDKLKLERSLVINRLQLRKHKSDFNAIKTISETSGTSYPIYVDWSIKKQKAEPYIFGQRPIINPEVEETSLGELLDETALCLLSQAQKMVEDHRTKLSS